MTTEFEARDEVTSNAISTVLSRWQQPRWYRSFGEFQRALGVAYQDRADLLNEAVRYAIHHADAVTVGLLFSTLCEARSAAQHHAWECEGEARRSDLKDNAADSAVPGAVSA